MLGEVYWKCMVGELTSVSDYISGRDVLSREASGHQEVRWSQSAPMPWPVIARGFGLPVNGPGAVGISGRSSGGQGGSNTLVVVVIVIVLIVLACVAEYCDDEASSSGGGVHIGGGVFSGGK